MLWKRKDIVPIEKKSFGEVSTDRPQGVEAAGHELGSGSYSGLLGAQFFPQVCAEALASPGPLGCHPGRVRSPELSLPNIEAPVWALVLGDPPTQLGRGLRKSASLCLPGRAQGRAPGGGGHSGQLSLGSGWGPAQPLFLISAATGFSLSSSFRGMSLIHLPLSPHPFPPFLSAAVSWTTFLSLSLFPASLLLHFPSFYHRSHVPPLSSPFLSDSVSLPLPVRGSLRVRDPGCPSLVRGLRHLYSSLSPAELISFLRAII